MTVWEQVAGGMIQVVEHLLCKCEALSLNHSTAKKKKKTTLREVREFGVQ
jgi:hypothetical protein